MRKFYFTPGPSQLYFTVESHMNEALKKHIPSISHRSAAFEQIYRHAADGVRALLGLKNNYHVLFVSSATEIWERIGQNLVGNESFHFVNGAFSDRFHNTIEQLGKNALKDEVAAGKVVNVDKVLIPESVELIAFTQNETSTGAQQPLEDIYKVRKAFKNQLIAVDMVSAAPITELDYSQVDTAYFSVQKCFGLPAGLGVWIVNDRCISKCEHLLNRGHSIGSYHSLPVMREKAAKHQTPETPNVLNIYLLGKVVEDMLNKGLDKIRKETLYKSAVLYQAFEDCSYLSPFVKEEAYRSETTPVAVTEVDSTKIIEAFDRKGLVIGSGYGKFKKEHIRIANFPTHSKEQIEMIADLLHALKF